ncbi:MAG: DUF1800 domain-containing protein [Saprospiraceae bacterium]|nr:DUF1800 domain-containing protein [Saprospiraceae bacterium]
MQTCKILLALLFMASWCPVNSQNIILGGTSNNSVKIYTSENWQPFNRKDSCKAVSAFNGDGLVGPYYEASRFLYQATLGASEEEIRQLAFVDFGQWIDQQQKIKYRSLLDDTRDIMKEVIDWHYLTGGDSADAPSYANWLQFQYAWWNQHMLQKDRLRQRVALALSEIFVISIESDLQGFGEGLASYYDILKKHAFGNYRELLTDVSLHPTMGFFLSHLNNPKTDTAQGVRPDENYAREIMQLFSIGLLKLNPDGSPVLDSAGQTIPTYSQKEIQELAKVFTGLGIAKVVPNMYLDTAIFGMGIYLADMTVPMRMYPRMHEPGEKILLDGAVVPAGQDGMQDIRSAIDILFNHPNVGPFLGKQLIQRLIKSNPSPDYVARVTQVFNDDGQGVRGNLAAVIKAILLDPEARDCDEMMSLTNGQLREPLLRYTHFTKALDIEQYYGRFWNTAYYYWQGTGHIPLASPTVFNFFSPFYSPKGDLDQLKLAGPEFQIHNSRTSIGYINQVNNWAIHDYVMNSWETDDPYATINTRELEDLAQDPEVLLNRLDILLTHGQLSDRTRQIIKTALEPFKFGNYREERVRMALYLIMISPDYAIFK